MTSEAELIDEVNEGPTPSGTPPLWLELCIKYNVQEFGAEPLPLPTFENTAPTTDEDEQDEPKDQNKEA